MHAQHTPTPWSLDVMLPFIVISRGECKSICECDPGDMETTTNAEAHANAAFIVRACNSFEALVEALKDVDEFCQQGLNSGTAIHWTAALADIMVRARAALAQAGEGA